MKSSLWPHGVYNLVEETRLIHVKLKDKARLFIGTIGHLKVNITCSPQCGRGDQKRLSGGSVRLHRRVVLERWIRAVGSEWEGAKGAQHKLTEVSRLNASFCLWEGTIFSLLEGLKNQLKLYFENIYNNPSMFCVPENKDVHVPCLSNDSRAGYSGGKFRARLICERGFRIFFFPIQLLFVLGYSQSTML